MLMLEVGVNWSHIQKTLFLKKGIYFPDNPLVEIWPKWHWIRSNVHIKCFSRISPFWLIHRYWHTLRTSSPRGQWPYMIAPSKCQDALNQVMISSSVKIHHVQPTTDMYITCIVSSPCYMRMIKIIRTNITHNIFTINVITTATTNIVITIITIDQCCWDSAVWRRNMFDQFLTYCSKAPPWPVCILCWVKYIFSFFSLNGLHAHRCLPCCFVKMHRVLNLLQRLQTVHPAATSAKHKAEPPSKYEAGILEGL